jgi:hypothetical protein
MAANPPPTRPTRQVKVLDKKFATPEFKDAEAAVKTQLAAGGGANPPPGQLMTGMTSDAARLCLQTWDRFRVGPINHCSQALRDTWLGAKQATACPINNVRTTVIVNLPGWLQREVNNERSLVHNGRDRVLSGGIGEAHAVVGQGRAVFLGDKLDPLGYPVLLNNGLIIERLGVWKGVWEHLEILFRPLADWEYHNVFRAFAWRRRASANASQVGTDRPSAVCAPPRCFGRTGN